MIFIWAKVPGYRVFFVRSFNSPVGDIMNKSGILITSALLSLGLAAGAMAADMPKAADAPAAAASAPAASMDAPKATKKKHHKKKKAAAPATTK
jgi:hypothetical protein